MSFAHFKDIASIFQALVTSLALILGGIWTYQLFIRRRQPLPRAKIEHQVTSREASANARLLSINVVVSNTSDVLLALTVGNIDVHQVFPPGGDFQYKLNDPQAEKCQRVNLMDWPALFPYAEIHPKTHTVEIEPGESEQFFYALLVRGEVKTIYIKSYFRNTAKRRKDLGWGAETFHDVLPSSATSAGNAGSSPTSGP